MGRKSGRIYPNSIMAWVDDATFDLLERIHNTFKLSYSEIVREAILSFLDDAEVKEQLEREEQKHKLEAFHTTLHSISEQNKEVDL